MIAVPLLALLIGFFIATALFLPVRGEAGIYLGVACLAGLDSVCGGLRSGLEGKFHNDIFVTGFISNTLIAVLLAWLGDKIGINLYIVSGIVFGTRIFTNLSLIRRYIVTKWQDDRERRRQANAQATASGNP